jgi:hypothetical protein
MCKGLQQEILRSFRHGYCFKVCTPTHKSALIANATTIFNSFNISPVDYKYIKTTVDKLKEEGVTWIFIDEVSMISSKVWSVNTVLSEMLKIYMVLSLFYLVIFTNYQVLKLIIMI